MISPDGRHLAFVGTSAEGRTEIWIRPLDSLSAHPLGGTADASYLFWSPDSQQVAFFADRKLKKAKLTGSRSEVLCDAPLGRGGAWSPTGIIVFVPVSGNALQAVSENGGAPETLTTLGSNPPERAHLHPRFLLDGRRFLFLSLSSVTGGASVFVSALGRRGYRAPIGAAADTESDVV